MRELLSYERETWFSKEYNDFTPPAFLAYGDEMGECYDSICQAEHHAGTYGSAEIAEALQVEILDTHYSNLVWLLENPDLKEIDSLPSLEQVAIKYDEFSETDDKETATKRAYDWAHGLATIFTGGRTWAH